LFWLLFHTHGDILPYINVAAAGELIQLTERRRH
jgi:hypothetical protein